MKTINIYVDGASRGNPGPASYGVCIQDIHGKMIKEISRAIGIQTNNFAEYSALKCGLEEAHKLGAQELNVFTDSELVANQFNGIYRVKHQSLQMLLAEIRQLEKKFRLVKVQHILRSSHPGNKRADRLANMALDKES